MATLTAQGIASTAVPLLSRKLILPNTVSMVGADGFAAPNGETVTLRVRAPRTARTQDTPLTDIVYDALSEIPVDVSLKHVYDATLISVEALTYDLANFATQVTEPQVDSVATGAEQVLYDVMNGLTADINFAATATPADTKSVVQTARETMSQNLIPLSERFLAVAPDIHTRLMDVDEFVRADALGDGRSSALRDAIVGRILGFTVVEGQGLTDGTAVAYHRSGFAMGTKMPAPYLGATQEATHSEGGINIRQILHPVPAKLGNGSVLSTFCGAAAVYEDGTGTDGTDNDRFIKIGTSA